MTKAPLVTVLMPAYNAGPFLKEAVDSVLNQHFTDFELLVINDGSTDNTSTILESYTDPRLVVVHQENIGLVRSLNKGLQLARGSYIARFDADDVCFPDRLSTQVAFLNQHSDYVLVSGETTYMDEDGNYLFHFRPEYYTNNEIIASGFKSCPFIHSAVMARKEALLNAGGYDPRALTFEDHLLWKKLAKQGKMCNLPIKFIKVRFNVASVTIDEKWRGEAFIALKSRSIEQERVSDEDYDLLVSILKKQNLGSYKLAAYHSLIGKKYLWNQYDPVKARKHFAKAIQSAPSKMEPYALTLLSLFPKPLIEKLYKTLKKGS